MPVNNQDNTVVLVMNRGDEDVKLITTLLEKAGFSVFLSDQELEVLNFVRSAPDSVQLVIADATTPGMNTSELLQEVQAADPKVRALLISDQDHAKPSGSLTAMRNVYGLLSRPFRRAQFLGSVLEAAKAPLVRTA